MISRPWAKKRPESGASARPNPIRAKAFDTKVKSYDARLVRPARRSRLDPDDPGIAPAGWQSAAFAQPGLLEFTMRLKYRRALDQRQRRHARVRAKVNGTAARPRLNVFRSSAHIYVQVIDDTAGHTLVAADDRD